MLTTIYFASIAGLCCFYLLLRGWKRRQYSIQQMEILLGIILISLALSWALGADGIITGERGDLEFHLWRVEAIKEGILQGQFPVRVYPVHMNGYGYASGIFYGDVLLYIPALLRILGFSINFSYKFLLFFINLLTVLLSYLSFRKISGSREIGIIAAALYSFNPYRIYDMYARQGLGESIAISFIPLVFCGLYLMSEGEEELKWGAIASVSVGASGIIQSHILSAELVCGFSLLFALLKWKSLKERKRIGWLFAAGGWVLVLNIWFILPFLDSWINNDLLVQGSGAAQIQEKGVPLIGITGYMGGGMGIGEALLMVMACYLFQAAKEPYADKEYQKNIKNANQIFILSAVAVILSADIVPYDFLLKNSAVLRKLIGIIQFPYRFLGIATVFLVLLFAVMAMEMKREDRYKYRAFSLLVLVTAVMAGMMSQYNILRNDRPFYYGQDSLNNNRLTQIVAGEYLPGEVDVAQFYSSEEIEDPYGILQSYERNGTSFRLSLDTARAAHNTDGGKYYIELPVVYYYGYAAFEIPSHKKSQVEKGGNGKVRLSVEEGYQGTMEVRFSGKWYWRAADIISLLAWVIFAGNILITECPEKMEKLRKKMRHSYNKPDA